jgi:hypothetical protein
VHEEERRTLANPLVWSSGSCRLEGGQSDWLNMRGDGGHTGEEQHDILVLDVLVFLGPTRHAVLRLLPRSRQVLASRPHPTPASVRVRVGDDPQRLLGEARPPPDPAVGLREHARHTTLGVDAVPNLLSGRVVRARGVDNAPPPVRLPVVVAGAIGRVLKRLLLDNKAIARVVGCRARWRVRERNNVGLDDRVRQAIDHRVDTKREEVLVMLGKNTRSHRRSERVLVVIAARIDLHDASQANFELDGAILIEVVVPNVFVVRESADLCRAVERVMSRQERTQTYHAHDEPTSSDRLAASTRTEVGVLPKEPGILFVDAYDVLDHHSGTIMCGDVKPGFGAEAWLDLFHSIAHYMLQHLSPSARF